MQFRLKVPKARCHLHSISQATQVHSLNLESGIPGQFWMCPSFSMTVRGILKPSKATIAKTICSNFLEFRIFEAKYVAVVHYANLRPVRMCRQNRAGFSNHLWDWKIHKIDLDYLKKCRNALDVLHNLLLTGHPLRRPHQVDLDCFGNVRCENPEMNWKEKL